MVPAYVLIIDIIAKQKNLGQEQFQSLISLSLSHLDALKGAFEKSPCTVVYYPPGDEKNELAPEYWCMRAVVMISVGQKRGEYLISLYEAIVNLIILELPDFEVRASVEQLKFG
jgi:hypothetical protein